MKAWQYDTTKGGLEKNLYIRSTAPVPQTRADSHLVRVLATSLNPVDYKLSEVGLLSRLAIRKPACPGLDIAGWLVKPASGSTMKAGQLVAGAAPATSLMAGGGLAQYAQVSAACCVPVPEGITAVPAASIPIAGLTAWQTILPFVEPGARLFIVGGSGGVGTLGVQIAKLHGCHVTCSCSTTNVALCRSLGADEVIDYRKEVVIDSLRRIAKDQKPFDHVVDLVGSDYELYWRCHEYTQPGAKYVSVAAPPTWDFALFMIAVTFWPSFLGGGKRHLVSIFGRQDNEQLARLYDWIAEKKLKPVIDETFAFEQAVAAFQKLKTGRARGKIVVEGAI